MTNKAAVKWPIMQISTLLRLKHCLRSHIESTSCNECKQRFSHFLATFFASIGLVSQQTLRTGFTCKNSRWRPRKQSSATKIKGELRAFLRLCWTALKTNWSKKMRIYNTTLKLARFIHIMLRKNVLNSRQFPEYFGIFFGGLKSRCITKKFHLHISGKIYWLLPGI